MTTTRFDISDFSGTLDIFLENFTVLNNNFPFHILQKNNFTQRKLDFTPFDPSGSGAADSRAWASHGALLYGTLSAVCHLQSAVYCLLSAVCCLLFAVCCLLFAVPYLLVGSFVGIWPVIANLLTNCFFLFCLVLNNDFFLRTR
jgi:hypothetical protein